MDKLESAFIRTFKWADKNGNLWRAGGDDDNTTEDPFSQTGKLLALMNEPFDVSNMVASPPPQPFDPDDPARVVHPYIYNIWYSKSCGTLNNQNIPTTKPPCHICGWPSIRKKNDSFTFCSSCRNCQKVRTHFEQWSKQSGVRGSNRGRKKAKNNLPQRRGSRKKIESTRLEPGAVEPLAISAPPAYTYNQTMPSIDPTALSAPTIPPTLSTSYASIPTNRDYHDGNRMEIALPSTFDTPTSPTMNFVDAILVK